MKIVWTSFKFIYLYIAYWLVGLTEEDFYITKGNYFCDLEKFHSAISCFKKALDESEMYFLYASIGWCYAALENDAKALEFYRQAYKKIKKHYVTVFLAFLEMECGNYSRCKEVFENIRERRDQLPDESLEYYDEVKSFLEKAVAVN